MQPRLLRWAIIVVLMLGLSSIIGAVVNASIKPSWDYDDRYPYRYTSVPTARAVDAEPDEESTDAWFANLPGEGQQSFAAPRTPTPTEATLYARTIAEAINARQNARGWQAKNQFRDTFDTRRTVEEWVRFGHLRLARTERNVVALLSLESAVDAALTADDATLDTAFAMSNVTVESVAFGGSMKDVVVLAKHTDTSKAKGARKTWYTRWWLHERNRKWHLYDFELQGGGVRWAAVAAQENLTTRLPAKDMEAGRRMELRELALRAGHATDGRSYEPYATATSAEVDHLVLPLKAVRQALTTPANPREVAHLTAAAAVWDDTPVVWLLMASGTLSGDLLKALKLRYGATATILGLEADILTLTGDEDGARKVLARAAVDYPGHPAVLAAKYTLTPAAEAGGLGEEAARSAVPGAALAAVINRHARRAAGLPEFIDSYRALRPSDPTGGIAWSVILAIDKRKPREAAALLRESLAEFPPERRVAVARTFEDWYTERNQAHPVTMPSAADDPHLGPILRQFTEKK